MAKKSTPALIEEGKEGHQFTLNFHGLEIRNSTFNERGMIRKAEEPVRDYDLAKHFQHHPKEKFLLKE